MTDSHPAPKQQLWNPKPTKSAIFSKLPEKIKLLEKLKLPDKTGFKLTEIRNKERFLPVASCHS